MAARRPLHVPLAGLLLLLLLLLPAIVVAGGHAPAESGGASSSGSGIDTVGGGRGSESAGPTEPAGDRGGPLRSGGATATGPGGHAGFSAGTASPVTAPASTTASPAATAGPARSGHGTGVQPGLAGIDLRASLAASGAPHHGPCTGTAAFDPGAARSAERGGRSGAPTPGDGERHRAPSSAPYVPPARSGLDPTGPAPGIPGADGSGGRTRKEHAQPPGPVTGDVVVADPRLLLRFLLVLGFRRVRPGNVLEHPLRRAAHAAIRAEPGLDLAGCAAATGANRETLRYHLALLVCCGKVVEETRSGSVRYFPHDPALTPVRRALLHALRNESLAPMLAAVRDGPGISRGELADRLGVAGPSVTRQVQRLIDEGLVEAERHGRSTCYRLTAECAAAFEPALAASAEGGTVRGRASA